MNIQAQLENELDRLDKLADTAGRIAERKAADDPDVALRALDTAARLAERKAAVLGLHRDTE